MKKIFLAVLGIILIGCSLITMDAAFPKILATKRIWNEADHNAFTDLVRYQDLFFCAFRESDNHAGGAPGTIRILFSKDGETWFNGAVVQMRGLDLRDPMLSEMPDGRLMLNVEGAIYDQYGKFIRRNPFVAFSKNGIDWTPLIDLGMDDDWIWRVTWKDGIGYAFVYHATDYQEEKIPWSIRLVKTENGLKYDTIKSFEIPGNPSEATIRFKEDGSMVTLLRRSGNAWIGHSSIPYDVWEWNETKTIVGGPNFLILPNGKMWAAMRKVDLVMKGKEKVAYTNTVLARMNEKNLFPEIVLPSGGDTGYPGMVYHNGKLFISYYSSHERKPGIYLSLIELPDQEN